MIPTGPVARPQRPAARLLVLDEQGRLLLFRFTPSDRPPFWCTPGGALEPGESYEDGARRELWEETGLALDPGPCVAVRNILFTTLEGIEVAAEEHYFLVRTQNPAVRTDGHTPLERAVMLSYRWWTPEALSMHDERWYPEDLLDLWGNLAAP
jgi:8-oxo-dGTP diphosphatase